MTFRERGKVLIVSAKNINRRFATLQAAVISVAVIFALVACCIPNRSTNDGESVNALTAVPTRAEPARIMVKFTDANAEVERPAFAEQLAGDPKVVVRYLRPMSGGAHIYLLDGIHDDAHLNAIVQGINRRSDVIYAEIDRRKVPLDSTKGDQ